MLKYVIICTLLVAATAAEARDLAVPAIGCPSDGQLGPQPAPKPGTVYLPLETEMAAELAYYRAGELGVLAPRGWKCLRLYGSSGALLLVTPPKLKANDFGVQLTIEEGGTSGRFGIAQVASRIFPQARKFVAGVAQFERDAGNSVQFATQPWPADRLTQINRDIVEYVTTAGSEGLGTQSRLEKNDMPISGVAILSGPLDEPNLTLLAVRLPPEMAPSTRAIINQVESNQTPGTHR